jgi:23S rRNA (uracil1939-C5)-methyltransferase
VAQPEHRQLRIRTLAHGGAGIGEPTGDAAPDSGPVWFVEGALPGELVVAQPLHHARRHVRGSLLEVIEPSPLRVAPPCPVAEQCGGCAWQHVDPTAQLGLKTTIVADQLRRLVSAQQVHEGATGRSDGYRRRARMHWSSEGGWRLGFLRPRSHEILDIDRCPVLVPALDEAMQRLRKVADHLPATGELLGLTDGEHSVLGLPGVRPDPATIEALTSLIDDRLVGIEVRGGRQGATIGRPVLEIDRVAGMPPMLASAFVFTQAHATVNVALVRHVARFARADALRVLELFAGAGNFTRLLAKTASRVWASDTDREAIELLRRLIGAARLPINAKRQSATRLLPKLAQAHVTYPVVVLDPPRAGLGREASAALAKVAAERIVYVSCDPSTLARDLEVITAGGFVIADVTVFDMMPMTPEVEVVATLKRGRA